MIGNDIVDLKHISSNWKRPRYLDKVFTEKEQVLISSAEHQHQLVWLLWSMKEAAYKVHVQQFGERFFNPKRLECELMPDNKGLVIIDHNTYFTVSTTTENYVYTIARIDLKEDLNTAVFKSEDSSYSLQSMVLKENFLKSISETQDLQYNMLHIKKTDIGIPQLFNNSKKLPIDFSLSHCGRFSGFAYQ